MDYERGDWRPLKRQVSAAYGSSVAGQSPVAAG